MKIDILGMGARFRSCRSLQDFERAVYQGNPPTGVPSPDPAQAALDALEDASPGPGRTIAVISNRRGTEDHLEKASLAFQFQMLAPLQVRRGAIFHAWQEAQGWLEAHESGLVLIVLGDKEGSGALLIGQSSSTQKSYATVSGLALGKEMGPVSKQALDRAGISPSLLGLIECLDPLEEMNFAPLSEVQKHFPRPDGGPQTAVGCLRPVIVDTTGIAGLTKTALALHRRSLYGYALQERNLPQPSLSHSSFYIPSQTRPWLDAGESGERRAAVLGHVGPEKHAGQLVLNESPNRRTLPEVRNHLPPDRVHLIPFSGQNESELIQSFNRLEKDLARGKPMREIATRAYHTFRSQPRGYSGALVAHGDDQLQQEIERARQGIGKALSTQQTWTTPRGSYFTAKPLGSSGVAFVYPGAFNSYPGMGRDLFQVFPSLHKKIHTLTPDISHSLAETYLFPRSLVPLSKEEETEHARQFFQHPVELIESGISLSVLHTLLLKDIFQVSPAAAFGYSLGEISMLWAHDIWQNAPQSSETWQESPLFKDRLFGPKTAVREYLNLEDSRENDDFWGSYILKASRQEVQSVIEGKNRAYMTIINAPGEVVIAGLDTACREVISTLDCHALPMPFDAVIHNPAMQSTYDDFVNLYTNDVDPEDGILFYSAAEYQPLILKKDNLARDIARMTCEQVDFPRLVHTVYQGGPRIFIEVGPQKTCSRWIEKILQGQDHAVIPINKKYQADGKGVLKVLALLFSHQVPMDLSPLYDSRRAPDGKDEIQPPSREDVPGRSTVLPGASPRTTGPLEEGGNGHAQEETGVHQTAPDSSPFTRYYRNLDRLTSRTAQSHRAFLDHQAQTMGHLKDMVALKLAVMKGADGQADPQPPLFSEEDIRAFTLGDPQECFGPSYAVFEGRRIPRLPNGPFRFIDRVVDIGGRSGKVETGSWLESEVDLPAQDWYFSGTASGLPYVAIMEIALQPCGFLSAYLGSTLDKPHTDFYFRNLDGEGSLVFQPPFKGRIVKNRVELLSTSRMGEIIIQKYAFRLSCQGQIFYRGETSFGYFTSSALDNQVGLDKGRRVPTWKEQHGDRGRWMYPTSAGEDRQHIEPSQPALPRIDNLWVAAQGGQFNRGYLYLQYPIRDRSWYFDAHFHQDPVMPGSLGVELMSQALQKGSRDLGLPEGSSWRIKPGSTTHWKYRGQVTRRDRRIQLEIHIKEIIHKDQHITLTAKGSLWNNDLRIYEVDPLVLESSG